MVLLTDTHQSLCAGMGRWGGADPVVSGLAAVLLGTCALPSAHEPGAPAGGAANGAVLDAIAAQLGIGAYFSCIAALRDTPAFAAAAAAQAPPQPLTRESAAAATALVDGSSDDENEGVDCCIPSLDSHAIPSRYRYAQQGGLAGGR